MNTSERIEAVNKLIARKVALEAAWAPLISAVKNHDFPAWEESWKTFNDYLETTAKLIGDMQHLWLHWFIHDNKCGRRGQEAKAASWKKSRQIVEVADLVDLIEADLDQ